MINTMKMEETKTKREKKRMSEETKETNRSNGKKCKEE